MRERWYGDKRDLVKWAAIVHIARETGARRVIQAVFKSEEENLETLSVVRNETQIVPFAAEVWNHFRNLNGIAQFGKQVGIPVEVFNSSWENKSRNFYVNGLVKRIKQLSKKRLVVLLDPDTGIEPKKGDLQHVRKSEVKFIFESLKPGDSLVLYQHARRSPSWVNEASEVLASTLGSTVAIHTIRYTGNSSVMAKDVAFLAVTKH